MQTTIDKLSPKIVVQLMTEWYLCHEPLAFIKIGEEDYTINALLDEQKQTYVQIKKQEKGKKHQDMGANTFVEKAIRYTGFIIVKSYTPLKDQKHLYVKLSTDEAIDYWFLYTS